MKKQTLVQLSDEQQLFVDKALSGMNILVDACIGSGKTTAIQRLCCAYPETTKILYLTYNKLLMLDAKGKIKNKNVTVTNYHGFAYGKLLKEGVQTNFKDCVQHFNKIKPEIEAFDVLIIDEYQDIELELSELLEYIKSMNPAMQIIAVGDMEQKIYDKTTLDVRDFIRKFLETHIELTFTKCFRLSAGLAEKLGRIWKKEIIGVNDACIVEQMTIPQVVKFLSVQDPKDILCLGAHTGDMTALLNELERTRADKFNKRTVYASIVEQDSLQKQTPNKSSAIFTTFDSSKGLERKICVVCDFTEDYWNTRVTKPQQDYSILRNIFCVAASRGKEHIIFVSNRKSLLSEETLSTNPNTENEFDSTVEISEMFDFKYAEDIKACRDLLTCTKIAADDDSVIDIDSADGFIDLSPCIGIYQEAVFFSQDQYNIDKEIDFYFMTHKNTRKDRESDTLSLDEKILYLTALETKHERYRTQVATPFIHEEERTAIIDRLSKEFTRDEKVQVPCEIPFYKENSNVECFHASGLCDVLKDGAVYELKFVSELSDAHFLQCACYMIALEAERGVLWNTRDNTRYDIRIPDQSAFLDAVAKAITKRKLNKYHRPTACTKTKGIVQHR